MSQQNIAVAGSVNRSQPANPPPHQQAEGTTSDEWRLLQHLRRQHVASECALIVGVSLYCCCLQSGPLSIARSFFVPIWWATCFGPAFALGCLALLLLQHLTGGAWGLVIRRVLEAATRTLPLMALLFIPIILGARQIYPWTHHEEMSKTPALAQKAHLYLNVPFFAGRAALYFAIWILLAYLLTKWSREQDVSNADRRFARRMRMIERPGPGSLGFDCDICFGGLGHVA